MKGTIKSKEEINFLFKEGYKISTKHLLIIFSKKNDSKYAVIAGKKIGNAVIRNKNKRLLRNLVQELKKKYTKKVYPSIILVAKKDLRFIDKKILQTELFKAINDYLNGKSYR